MNIKKHIPNAITCGNLLCGCLAIVKAFEGDLVWAAYLVGIAAALDFFDGFAARMLKVSSPIGKDLDSLADMVTFGVVPGVVMYNLLKKIIIYKYGVDNHSVLDYSIDSNDLRLLIPYVSLLIPIFSCIRLAKFNNDTRQSDSFIGVPTPANAILLCSLILIVNFQIDFDFFYEVLTGKKLSPLVPIYYGLFGFKPYANNLFTVNDLSYLLTNEWVYIGIILIFCFLLVAELPLFALKFKHFKWKGNEIRFVFLGLSLVMLITLQFIGIPLIIIMYILLSVINNIISRKRAVS